MFQEWDSRTAGKILGGFMCAWGAWLITHPRIYEWLPTYREMLSVAPAWAVGLAGIGVGWGRIAASTVETRRAYVAARWLAFVSALMWVFSAVVLGAGSGWQSPVFASHAFFAAGNLVCYWRLRDERLAWSLWQSNGEPPPPESWGSRRN